MSRPTRILSRLLSIFAALALSVLFVASPAAADEIFTIFGTDLYRLGVDGEAMTRVAPIDLVGVTSLAFTPEGDLVALLGDGSLYLVDPETAASVLARPAPGTPGSAFEDLAAAPGGFVYLLDVGRQELTFLPLGQPQTATVVAVHPVDDLEYASPPRGLAMLQGFLVSRAEIESGDAPSGDALLSIGAITGSSSPLLPLPPIVGERLDLDSDDDLWHSSVTGGPVAQARVVLQSIDLGTGEPTGKPVYTFPLAETLANRIPFAVRRGAPPTCRADGRSLCLLGGRFRVTVDWRSDQQRTGIGRPVPDATDESGLFWFFTPDNWELTIKMLDACDLNGRTFVFLSATTDVEYEVTITDTVTGDARIYRNELGQPSTPVLDVEAFPGCLADTL